MEVIFQKILKKIKPTEKDEKDLDIRISRTLATLKKSLEKNKIKAELFVGGSVAKGTYLKNDRDVDLFLRFPPGTEDISNLALKACSVFEPTIMHGSRDYFSFKNQYLNFELIPVYAIKTAMEAKNIMDNSPLHVAYIREHLLRHDDVRLLKYLCKMNNLYGAESYMSAFSGYVLELLIAHYGSFQTLIKEAVNWEEGEIIDPSKHYKNKESLRERISKSKLTSLILIDPVQKDRNAATSLSKESFNRFKKLCRQVLAKPSTELFENQNTITKIKNRARQNNYFLVIKESPMEGKQDIFLSKLDKRLRKIIAFIERLDFTVIEQGLIIGRSKARLYIVIKHRFLPEIKRMIGPPSGMKEHVKRFEEKWKNKSLRGPYIYACHSSFDVERKIIDAKDAVNLAIKKVS